MASEATHGATAPKTCLRDPLHGVPQVSSYRATSTVQGVVVLSLKAEAITELQSTNRGNPETVSQEQGHTAGKRQKEGAQTWCALTADSVLFLTTAFIPSRVNTTCGLTHGREKGAKIHSANLLLFTRLSPV